MILPEPARTLWVQVADVLEGELRARLHDFDGWMLGGGTVLAARWTHRSSTYIDLKVDVRAGLAMLKPQNDRRICRRASTRCSPIMWQSESMCEWVKPVKTLPAWPRPCR